MANQPNEDVAYLPVSFDGLPDDLLLFIFRRLPLNDLIKCRLVSSTFKPIVSQCLIDLFVHHVGLQKVQMPLR